MARLPLLSEQQILDALDELPGWEHEGETLTKRYRFPTFLAGIDFVREVAELAEAMNHHPDITIRFHLITFTLTTHGSKGITENDVALARAIEQASIGKAK